MRYEVLFTPPGKERDVREFRTKRLARKFAGSVIAQGATVVFLDTFNADDDLIHYENLAG